MPPDDSIAPPDAGARYAERRLVRRYVFSAPAEVLEPLSRARTTARAAYLSMNGCFIETPEQLPVNTVIQIRIRQGDDSFETWGRVASVRSGSPQESAGIGVGFFQADPPQEAILVKWIERLQAEQPDAK